MGMFTEPNRLLVYYAHAMSLYGTIQEKRDLETLQALGFEVLNPNSPEHQAHTDMPYYLSLVAQCGALAFRAMPDGSITAGVSQEIGQALSLLCPVFELPSGIIRRTLTIPETKEVLRELGQR